MSRSIKRPQSQHRGFFAPFQIPQNTQKTAMLDIAVFEKL